VRWRREGARMSPLEAHDYWLVLVTDCLLASVPYTALARQAAHLKGM
jgi:hypothetical protein